MHRLKSFYVGMKTNQRFHTTVMRMSEATKQVLQDFTLVSPGLCRNRDQVGQAQI